MIFGLNVQQQCIWPRDFSLTYFKARAKGVPKIQGMRVNVKLGSFDLALCL